MTEPQLNPELDLSFERIVEVKPELVWKAWTTPEIVKKWFTPAPYKTIECSIDLRPGGKFYTVMESPEGERFPNAGCYLEIEPNKKLVWTSALEPGYRPVAKGENALSLLFTAQILIEAHPKGCRYRAIAMHTNAQEAKQHRDMGFEQGWGAALDQLVAWAKTQG